MVKKHTKFQIIPISGYWGLADKKLSDIIIIHTNGGNI